MSTPRAAVADAMAAGRFTELRKRLLFVLGAIIVFRIGTFITIPGIDPSVLADAFKEHGQDTILGLLNVFGGGALKRLSIFALGIMPYISASIIVQLLTKVHPKLEQLSKEGAAGKRKITQYTRILTLILAAFQAYGVAASLGSQPGMIIGQGGYSFYFTTIVTLMTGTMFLMWLGEQVTERGIGNGISLIIFAGIVAGIPSAIAQTFTDVSDGESLSWCLWNEVSDALP
jgi:preprotein translocase subunit SecY